MLLCSGVAAQPALAAEPSPSDKQAARALVVEGDRFFAERDYERALERYRAAYRLVPVPTVGIELVRAQVELGQWVEASAEAAAVAALPRRAGEPEVFERARREAAEIQRDLEERISHAEKEPPAASGAHAVTPADSAAPSVVPAVVPAAVPVAAPQSAEEPATSSNTGAYVALGLGGAAAVVGSIAGIRAFQTKPSCPAEGCTPAQSEDIETSTRWGHVADISFGAALLLGIYGIWQLADTDDAPAPSTARSAFGFDVVSNATDSVRARFSGTF